MLHSRAATSVVHRAPLLLALGCQSIHLRMWWRLPAGALELPPVVEPVIEPEWVHNGAYEAPAVECSHTGDARRTPLSLQLDAVRSPQQADACLQALRSCHLLW